MSILSPFLKPDVFRFRKLAAQCRTVWANRSEDFIKNASGFTPDEISARAAEEAEREALEPTKNAAQLQREFEALEQRLREAKAVSDAAESRRRWLYDSSESMIRLAGELKEFISDHAGNVERIKKETAQAAFDMTLRNDDMVSRSNFFNGVDFLASESHRLEAWKAALKICEAKLAEYSTELKALK